VLVAGGTVPRAAEIYDPNTGTWTITDSLLQAGKWWPATALLPDGRVLFAYDDLNNFPHAAIYDPVTASWSYTGTPLNAATGSRLTLLPNGKVLKAGGNDAAFGNLAEAELYDPATGSWTATGRMNEERFWFTMTLLPDGRVLAAGGWVAISSAELYDPTTGSWTLTANLAGARDYHTATLLLDGTLLVTGGYNDNHVTVVNTTELYDPGLGFSRDWQPVIDSASSVLTFGHRHLRLTGLRFQGISQASGGNTQDSSSNYPIVQLRSIDNSQVVFLPVDPVHGWSDTSFRSIPVRDFSHGPALVTVFTNGIPSAAKYLVVGQRHD
jgi:hypothetical protein